MVTGLHGPPQDFEEADLACAGGLSDAFHKVPTVIMTATPPGQLVTADHPACKIKPVIDGALACLSSILGAIYSRIGRPPWYHEHPFEAQLSRDGYGLLCTRGGGGPETGR